MMVLVFLKAKTLSDRGLNQLVSDPDLLLPQTVLNKYFMIAMDYVKK